MASQLSPKTLKSVVNLLRDDRDVASKHGWLVGERHRAELIIEPSPTNVGFRQKGEVIEDALRGRRAARSQFGYLL